MSVYNVSESLKIKVTFSTPPVTFLYGYTVNIIFNLISICLVPQYFFVPNIVSGTEYLISVKMN